MNIPLERDMPVHAALSFVLLFNLDIMEQNESGIIEDTNIEFLHDFRVANRRTRSLASQVKDVFPESELRRFKKAFSWLSKLTSEHRDLDVFLADIPVYANCLPGSGGELENLRELLQENHNREHVQLVRALNSARYADFRHGWRTFLEMKKAKSSLGEMGMLPVVDVAGRSIRKNYNRLLKQGDRIKTRYTYESIHKLRKDGKKLRYMLDAFKSLYPENDVLQVIKTLKKLQNNLGDIVDMHTQRYMLGQWKQEIQDPRTNEAISHLEKLCLEEEIKAGKKFNRQFSHFSGRENRSLFEDLFQ